MVGVFAKIAYALFLGWEWLALQEFSNSRSLLGGGNASLSKIMANIFWLWIVLYVVEAAQSDEDAF